MAEVSRVREPKSYCLDGILEELKRRSDLIVSEDTRAMVQREGAPERKKKEAPTKS